MVQIYHDYQDEPKDVFLPLPEELSCRLYALEMNNFIEDCVFYDKMLPQKGSILEMGCGTGRVAHYLANKNRQVTGIDTSLPMLRMALQSGHPHCSFFCMDMLVPAFRQKFDTILIPYNTLNLLVSEQRIRRCLQGCGDCLRRHGRLIVQLYIPTVDFLSNRQSTFQFQMFDRPGGGRIIKEILKKFLPNAETVLLEERFRIRPMQPGQANEDYRAITPIAAFGFSRWQAFFASAGFSEESICGNYLGAPYNAAEHACCLLVLKQQ